MESSVAALLPERRRQQRRNEAAEHGIVQARVKPGHHATIIDVSREGVLLETAHRLLPGSMVEVHLATTHLRVSVRGRVVRSAVAGVKAAGISYRGAIRFESALTHLLDPAPGAYTDPRVDRALRVHDGEDATHGQSAPNTPDHENG